MGFACDTTHCLRKLQNKQQKHDGSSPSCFLLQKIFWYAIMKDQKERQVSKVDILQRHERLKRLKEIQTDREKQLQDLKKAGVFRKILMITGLVLMVVGYILALRIGLRREFTYIVPVMLCLLVGVVLFARSLLHDKYRRLRKRIRQARTDVHEIIWAIAAMTKTENPPIRFTGTDVFFDSTAFLNWILEGNLNKIYEIRQSVYLDEKDPIIRFYEDEEKTCQYCLEGAEGENFNGKYFQISVRLALMGAYLVPMMQMDGFVSDTPEEREMEGTDIGYRMESHFLQCGGLTAERIREKSLGGTLITKGLKQPGRTVPAQVRLIGICPSCKNSFAFHARAFYMAQSDMAYSDDGLDCCEIQNRDIDKLTWSYETEGKTFRYYNDFCCPRCGAAYIDYKNHPENKVFGEPGCVLLDKTHYTFQ